MINLFLGIYAVIGGLYTVLVTFILMDKQKIDSLSFIQKNVVGVSSITLGFLLLSGHMKFIC